ncbi:uncharacterized protein LOC5521962 isoform X2 [Nematostella vectensis]|uniref:uncharacterized protein LOC5521962 isoform X2 n=1 Tax=Nematostella vectensis TaxID=45351 RepID=UPI002076EDCC|nr:uncharacterized protein LOC5521962 isoform X2 [Nematostella vectensis]
MILIRTFSVQARNDKDNEQRSEGSLESRSTEGDQFMRNAITQYLIRTTPRVLQILTQIAWQSYGYFFFVYIVGISTSSIGILYFVSQLTKALVIVLLKYFRQNLFRLSSRLAQHGQDKTLHAFGSIGVLIFWPFVLAPCVGCVVESTEGILVAAYVFPIFLYSASWTLVEVTKWEQMEPLYWTHGNHLYHSLKSCSQRSWLGITLHAVTWIFLALDTSGPEISRKTQASFSHQTIFILAVGFFATFLYQIASGSSRTRPRSKRSEKDVKENQIELVEFSSKPPLTPPPPLPTPIASSEPLPLPPPPPPTGIDIPHSPSKDDLPLPPPPEEVSLPPPDESPPSSKHPPTVSPSSSSAPPRPSTPPSVSSAPPQPTNFCDTPGTRPWRYRLQNLQYLQSMFTYVLSANTFNIFLFFLPVYLVESLAFDKYSAAYVPAVVFVGWGLGTLAGKKLVDVTGFKVLFCISSLVTFLASVWFYAQTESSKYVLYVPALMMGFSSCLAVVTSHMMVVIQSRATEERPVGVDDFTTTVEFLTNGFVVFIIMQLHPGSQSGSVDQYLRLVMFLVPALHVAVAIVESIFYVHLPLPPSQEQLSTEAKHRKEDIKIKTVRLNMTTVHGSGKELEIAEEDLKVLEDLPSTNV